MVRGGKAPERTVIDLCASSARPLPRVVTRGARARQQPGAAASSTLNPTGRTAVDPSSVVIDLCTPEYRPRSEAVEEPNKPAAKRPRIDAAPSVAAPGVSPYLASIDDHISRTESHGAARGHGAFLGNQPHMYVQLEHIAHSAHPLDRPPPPRLPSGVSFF